MVEILHRPIGMLEVAVAYPQMGHRERVPKMISLRFIGVDFLPRPFNSLLQHQQISPVFALRFLFARQRHQGCLIP